MEEVLTVLDSRGGGNNVLLNGPAGTGKTEFVRYLAYKINKNEIPGFEGYTVYSISGTELMQGAWMRGALEQRVIEIGRFLQSQEHAILFIDEIHQLVPGRDRRGEHGLDMAGQLLPYLTHRNVRVIGATTPDESEGMNQNRPFLQRFTSVSMPEMTRDLRQMVLGRLIQREEEREFTEGFAQRIMEYNQQHGKRSPREDKAFFNLIVSKMRRQGITADAAFQQVVESGAMTRNAESMPLFLSELTADLSEVSYSGRDREIGLLLDILYSKEEANNVILNADAGSGKTEMIRYIASRIRRGEIPGFENFKVYSTSAQELIAGGSQQGEVEKRVEKLFKFLDGEGDVILFVDEIHQLIGQRGIDGMFLTKLLKSRIRVIGATTPNEALALNYNRPFKQRFTMMQLASMTEELRLEIVRRCLERHAELEFPERFAQSLIQYNNSQEKNSVREDKQLLGIIASRMSRSRSTAATAFQQITMNEL
jgi:ATP-dependent Clp protease ATP-binding subunit ClpA